MTSKMPPAYTLVIDTNNYAGNFEREMTAFCTGVYGDCEVGREESSLFSEYAKEKGIKENHFKHLIRLERDEEHWIMRPCQIMPTPGRWNDGMGNFYDAAIPPPEKQYPAYESVGIFFSVRPLSDDMALIWARAIRFADYRGIVLKRMRLIQTHFTETDEIIYE